MNVKDFRAMCQAVPLRCLSVTAGFGKSVSQKAVWAKKRLDKQAYLEYAMFRKTKNTGCFESIKEPMQMRYIRKVAEFADIDLKDIKIEIVRDPELIGTGFCGYTFPNGKHIQLYPDAFLNRETLVKTLGHERVHCEQTKLFGTATNDNELNQYENAARFSEDYWWQCFLERMSLFEK